MALWDWLPSSLLSSSTFPLGHLSIEHPPHSLLQHKVVQSLSLTTVALNKFFLACLILLFWMTPVNWTFPPVLISPWLNMSLLAEFRSAVMLFWPWSWKTPFLVSELWHSLVFMNWNYCMSVCLTKVIWFLPSVLTCALSQWVAEILSMVSDAYVHWNSTLYWGWGAASHRTYTSEPFLPWLLLDLSHFRS